MTSNPLFKPTIPKRTSKMASSTQNVNHLINFTLPPRQQRPVVHYHRRGKKTGTQNGVWKQERFVNAQYRFIMNPTGDYTAHFADPDIFFQWHDILQVVVPRYSALASLSSNKDILRSDEGNTTCPICLSPPTAARMTKCGHVFCFPCILHYLSTSENKWARCPICFVSIIERQLKAVKWYDGPTHSYDAPGPHPFSYSLSSPENTIETTPCEGSIIKMKLIARPHISTLALPRSHTWPSDLLPPHQAPFHFLPDVFIFARFMLATPAYLLADLSRDLDELGDERKTLMGMKDDLGLLFIDDAEQKVRNQISKAATLETPALKEEIEKVLRDQEEIEKTVDLHGRIKPGESTLVALSEVPQEFLAFRAGNTNAAVHEGPSKLMPAQNRSGPKQRRNVNPPPPSTSTYYYYQASSGLPVFLHPLDIRILLSHFNSYASFPDTITIRVEAFSEGSVDDDLRKRCKYLSHMPEGADVVFIETNLEPVVGKEGLKNFEGPLKMRASRRKEKDRKDDRARIRAEERERGRERERWGNRPRSDSAWVHNPLVQDQPSPDEELAASPPPPLVTSGAWGTRSFASALHSTPGPASHNVPQRPLQQEDEWDAAWHDLQRDDGKRKKRGTRLLVLGGGRR